MKSVEFVAGNVKGWKISLYNGEGLPWHAHTENDAHMTIVCSGKIRVTTGEPNDYEWTDYDAGRSVHFPPGCGHSIIAIESDTVIYNILTGG